MFEGFKEADFGVFTVPGLDARMTSLKAHIRPKLEYLGQYFSTFLAAQIGEPVFAHVAKHARRTVNPPDDTWVAFCTNQRGYKQHPHFQIGLWETHAFVTFGYIYEATTKADFGRRLVDKAAEVHDLIPNDYVWIPDHTNPNSLSAADVSTEQIEQFGHRLETVKRAELLVGARYEADQVVQWSGEAFIDKAEDVFTNLVKLYRTR